MTFISYAQNFEDVMLRRALKDVDKGFYIDVGANDPVIDSVTKSFYDAGWHGINIEPVGEWYEKLQQDRPNDTNLQLAVGAKKDELDFYEVVGTGLSTMDESIAKQHADKHNFHIKTYKVPVTTLTAICEEYFQADIHFLKIDVEGAELSVFQGADLRKIRPWIILVESTLPNTSTDCHQEWEPILLASGYAFVYFDGLNRFYVANEHKVIEEGFLTPPNVLDNFIPNGWNVANKKANELHELSHHWWLESERLKNELQAVYRSKSWRITAPLRKMLHSYPTLERKLQLPSHMSGLTDNSDSLPANQKRQLFVDVSELAQKDSKTGVQRVTRSILKELLDSPPVGFIVEPVYSATNDTGYRYARLFTARFNGVSPRGIDEYIKYQSGDVFLGVDLQHLTTLANAFFLAMLRQQGVNVVFVVYDLLPIQFPQYWPSEQSVHSIHAEWLSVISQFDGAICISRTVANELKDWLKLNVPEQPRPFKVSWFHLGADIENSAPSYGLPENSETVLNSLSETTSFLMVGTIEPRKSHAQVLNAFERLWADDCNVTLVIVGSQGWMVEELIKRLNHHIESGSRLLWLNGISDEYLEKIYAVSTCLIAASEGEGFGLPLIEAAQHQLPIIARDIPVFREVAEEHAFYFDGSEAAALTRTIQDWLVLHKKNRHPVSDSMNWLTWRQSAKQLKEALGIYYSK